MKKTVIAMIMTLVILVGVIAQAEGAYVKAWRVADDGGKPAYFVTYQTESGVAHEFQVGEAEFSAAVEIIARQKNEAEHKKQVEEHQANRGSWLANVGAWLSFWNPED